MDSISGFVFDIAKEDVALRSGMPRRMLLVRVEAVRSRWQVTHKGGKSASGEPRTFFPDEAS